MQKFTLIFTEKPKNSSKLFAIKIADRNKYQIDDEGNYEVHFDEITTDLIKLLELSRGWSTSQFYVNDNNMDIREFLEIVCCWHKERCTGVCQRIRIDEFYTLERLHDTIERADKGEYWNTEALIRQIDGSPFVTACGKGYVLNKSKIEEEILKQIILPLQLCDKINQKMIIKKIRDLPSQFKILPNSGISFGSQLETSETELTFSGLTDYEIARIKAQAEIEAPIIAEAMVKALKKYFSNK